MRGAGGRPGAPAGEGGRGEAGEGLAGRRTCSMRCCAWPPLRACARACALSGCRRVPRAAHVTCAMQRVQRAARRRCLPPALPCPFCKAKHSNVPSITELPTFPVLCGRSSAARGARGRRGGARGRCARARRAAGRGGGRDEGADGGAGGRAGGGDEVGLAGCGYVACCSSNMVE